MKTAASAGGSPNVLKANEAAVFVGPVRMNRTTEIADRTIGPQTALWRSNLGSPRKSSGRFAWRKAVRNAWASERRPSGGAGVAFEAEPRSVARRPCGGPIDLAEVSEAAT